MPRQKSNFSSDYKVLLATLIWLREKSGRTQEDVAKAMKRSQSVVSKCELGLRRMDVVEVRQYCKGIGVEFPRFAEIYEANVVAGTVRKKRTY